MSQIKFKCSHCGQRLECGEEFVGSEIPCPVCKALTAVPPIAANMQASSKKSGMTHTPESWPKPEPGKPAPSPQKTGMTYVPESWRKPPPQPGAE
jgi:phage FluMu protein Com